MILVDLNPASSTDPMAIQIGFSVVIVHVIQFLKNSIHFPWLTEHTETLNGVMAAIAALLTTVGITFAFEGSFITGGDIHIHIPAVAGILSNAMRFFVQVGAQKAYYKLAVKTNG